MSCQLDSLKEVMPETTAYAAVLVVFEGLALENGGATESACYWS